jgi:hypothetical protein
LDGVFCPAAAPPPWEPLPLLLTAGLQQLVLHLEQDLATPLDDVLAPLTRLTALNMACGYEFLSSYASVPVPTSLARLTGLRDLYLWGFSQTSEHELRSCLSPLTQLTALTARIVVSAGCGLPELPSLQSLHVEQVVEGGLALLAASCPALVSLTSSRSVSANAEDAAARLPALTSLVGHGSLELSGAEFSLAGCAPALKSLRVLYGRSTAGPAALIDKLTGLSELCFYPAEGVQPVTMGARDWQALAALPALQCFCGSVELEEGGNTAACVSVCAQLRQLQLVLGGTQAPQLRCCLKLVAAMHSSRVRLLSIAFGPTAGVAQPELPTPLFEHLATWPRLSEVHLGCPCTPEQLSVLCASPTVTFVQLSWRGSKDDGRRLAHTARKLMSAQRTKQLQISIQGLTVWP